MKTVILCGGMGTRIREATENIPKPMIPIGGRPILWHIMKIYAHHGYTDFVLCLGYKAEVIKEFFVNYYANVQDFTVDLSRPNALEYHGRVRSENWKVTLAETGLTTLTGARVALIDRYLGDDDTFMLTYGDGVSDVDVRNLVEFHRAHGKLATLTGVHPVGRFGQIELDESHERVTSFAEKPQVSDGRINGGFFVINREFIPRYLTADPALILEQEPLGRCALDGELMSYPHDGYWQPMDTYREYVLLNSLWETGKAPWKVWD
jgi:glucose-1-phosphate cytidylyltransferase